MKRVLSALVVVGLVCSIALNVWLSVRMTDLEKQVQSGNDIELTHVFGVYPIFGEGVSGSWDDNRVEMGSILLDNETYYLYYHGCSQESGYAIGMAYGPTPYGPWTRASLEPMLTPGAAGEWDDAHVATPKVICIDSEYYMFYSGMKTGNYPKWGIGLATSDSPIGPWEKCSDGPLLNDFGYLGGISRVGNEFHMYSAYPIDPETDQGPINLATSKSLMGPWKIYSDNPIIPVGNIGTWSSGGFSESNLVHQGNALYMFLGASRQGGIGIGDKARRSSIGFAYSDNGVDFILSEWNPIVRAEDLNARYLGEAYVLTRSPLFLIYTTYITPDEESGICVSVVAPNGIQFKEVGIPALSLVSLEPGGSSTMKDGMPLYLGTVQQCTITVSSEYMSTASKALLVRVLSSNDGVNYDTDGLYVFENELLPSGKGIKTISLEACPRFITIVVENPDKVVLYDVEVNIVLSN